MRAPEQLGIERVTIAGRASRLALIQTESVAALLRAAHPGLTVEVVPLTTRGDRDMRPFAAIGGKGLFTSEVERAVVEGEADLAVHSAKDLTAALAPGCALLCVPERAARHDVVVGGTGTSGEARLRDLPAGAMIGTSSMRRRSLLAELRDDLEVVELRGNLDTRLAKVAAGRPQAAVLAAAGLERLGVASSREGALDAKEWVPAPAQGALAVEGLEGRDDLAELLAPIADYRATAEVECERAFAARLEGGCSVPLGCSAVVDGDRLEAVGYLGTEDGAGIRARIAGTAGDAAALGSRLAEEVLAAGGDAVLDRIDVAAAPPVEEP